LFLTANIGSMTYWLQDATSPTSQNSKPKDSSILIIGSGITGVSVAYFLLKEKYSDITLVDCGTENASYFRNAGHILFGAAESYSALIDLRGREDAKRLFAFSVKSCNLIKQIITDLNIECDYLQGNYFAIPGNKVEEEQLQRSIDLLNEDGFNYCELSTIPSNYGVKEVLNARLCSLSAQANPSKFRNGVRSHLESNGIAFHSFKVKELKANGYNSITVTYHDNSTSTHDMVIVATNAYSPLIDSYFKEKIIPFRGQIVVSDPIDSSTPKFSFSSEFGYMYGTIVGNELEKRLLLGGWRHHTAGEIGTYELDINPSISIGLETYAREKFTFIKPTTKFPISWSGIMGSTSGGLPLVGPVDGLIYTAAGCNGYGFAFSAGCAQLLTSIISGSELDPAWPLFRPR